MSTRYEAPLSDAMLAAADADEPIAEWTLDELDHYADLDSVRSAWAHTDGPSL